MTKPAGGRFPDAVRAKIGAFTKPSPVPGPELRQGPPTLLSDRLRDWIASKTNPEWADRAVAPLRFMGDIAAKPAVEGAYALSHPSGRSAAELAGSALDVSGVVPAGAFAKTAPLLSVFAGPRFMSRLEEAGRIASDAKGSEDALFEATRAWKRNEDPRKVWDQTGWAPGNAFGARFDGGYQLPMAWHGMPDLDFTDAVKNNPKEQTLALGDALRGADDLRTGAPDLVGLPMTVQIGPEVPSNLANTGYVRTTPDGRKLASIGAYSPSPEGARGILRHESTHAVHATDSSSNVSAAFDPLALARRTTPPAEKILTDHSEALLAKVDGLMDEFNKAKASGDYATMDMLRWMMEDARAAARAMGHKATDASRFGAYLNSSHERRARAASLNYRGNGGAFSPYPSDVDTFAEEALWPVDWSNSPIGGLLKLRDYEIPSLGAPAWAPHRMEKDEALGRMFGPSGAFQQPSR